jgi:hypothetical protein
VRLTAQQAKVRLLGVVAAERPDAREPAEPVQRPSGRAAEAAEAAEAAAQPGRAAGAAVPLIVARAVAEWASPVPLPAPTVPVLTVPLARVFSRRQEAPVLDGEARQEQPAADG